jgi:hypothetical protein
MFTKTQRIVASIGFGAAVGAFIGEVVSALSLLAGFASGGVAGGVVGFVALHYRETRQRAPEIWEEAWQGVGHSLDAFTKQFFKTVLSLLFFVGQWLAALFVLFALFATPESSSATSGHKSGVSFIVSTGGIFFLGMGCPVALLLLSMPGCVEAREVAEENRSQRELVSRKLLENLNIFMPVYYLICGIRWILFKPPKWMFFTVLPAVFSFLVRLTKAVYSDESAGHYLGCVWCDCRHLAGYDTTYCRFHWCDSRGNLRRIAGVLYLHSVGVDISGEQSLIPLFLTNISARHLALLSSWRAFSFSTCYFLPTTHYFF